MRDSPRAVAAVLAGLHALGLALPADAATYKIRWQLGHKNLDYFEEAAQKFKTDVEAGSKGDIEVEIVAAAEDRPAEGTKGPELAARVARGDAEMGHSFVDVMGGLDPALYVFEAPFLFRGYRHLEGVFEGPVGASLLEGLRAHGIVGLSFTYSGGATGIATTDREVRRPEDLKGLKIGVFGDAVEDAWLKDLGAETVWLGHSSERVLPLAREKALDGLVITWRNFERDRLLADFPNIGLLGSTYLVSVTYVNEKFFDGLPEAYRTLIANSSREAGRIERARTIELNESSKRELLGKGVVAAHLTEHSRDRFASALRPAYEGPLDRIVGKDLLDAVRRTGDAPGPASVPLEVARR